VSKHAVLEKEKPEVKQHPAEREEHRRHREEQPAEPATPKDAPVQQAAALPTISAFKPVENGVGVKSDCATSNPGIGILQATKPVGMVANGGIPVMAAVAVLNGGGASQYLPMPQGSIILSAVCSALGNPAGTVIIKLGNDNIAGQQDIGSFSITSAGAVAPVLLESVGMGGLTGNSLQITTPADATLAAVVFITYLVMH
jgi:hypothetical protein